MPNLTISREALDRLLAQGSQVAEAAIEGRAAAQALVARREAAAPASQPRLSGLRSFTRGRDDGGSTATDPDDASGLRTAPLSPDNSSPTRPLFQRLELPVEIARHPPTHDECRDKIGQLMRDLSDLRKMGMVDDETVQQSMHQAIVALVDDALSRGDKGAARCAVNYVDEVDGPLRNSGSADTLDEKIVDRVNQESRAYLTSRLFRPSRGWR